MHNIYIDGSSQVQNKLIGIGIYDSSNGFELSMVKTGDNVYDAEYGALEEAIRYCQINDIVKESRIFTDSTQIYNENKEYISELGFVDFIWIPRELNTVADRLSTQYKDYSRSTKTKLVLDIKKNTITKTTKIKETTHVNTLSKEQIIEHLNQYSIEKRMKLIEKLRDTSAANKTIWNYYFSSAKIISKNKKNTYFKLIPLLIPDTKNKKNRANLLNEISTDGIRMLLESVKNLKIKEINEIRN